MRILVYYFVGGGGGFSNIKSLLLSFAETHPEHELIFLCSEKNDCSGLDRSANIEILRIPDTLPQELVRFYYGIYKIKLLVARLRVDLLWSFNLGSYRAIGVPYVLSINNAFQVYPWSEVNSYPGRKLSLFFLRYFYRCSISVADAIVTQTNAMNRVCLASVRRQDISSLVLAKAVGADQSNLLAAGSEKFNDLLTSVRSGFERLWLYVATAHPHKNHDVIFAAFTILAKRNTRDCLVVTITRDEALEIGGETASTLIEQGRLVVLGWVCPSILPRVYDLCDYGLMPSLIESLSSAHLEAMRWGKPQIVSDLPYARDLCGAAAIYSNPHDPEQWADHICRLGSNSDLGLALVTEGIRVMSSYPRRWRDCAKILNDFFNSLLI